MNALCRPTRTRTLFDITIIFIERMDMCVIVNLFDDDQCMVSNAALMLHTYLCR